MENIELLGKICDLQSESKERDAKIETQLSFLSERMSKTETLLEKMSDILNSQKHLSSVVDTLAIQVGDTKNYVSNLATSISKIQSAATEFEKRIVNLENAPAQKTYQTFSKIMWIAIPVFVTAICSGVVLWVKNSFGG